MVGNGALVDDLAILVEHTNGVLLVAEVESDGDEWNFAFQVAAVGYHGDQAPPSLPSHLILLGRPFFEGLLADLLAESSPKGSVEPLRLVGRNVESFIAFNDSKVL